MIEASIHGVRVRIEVAQAAGSGWTWRFRAADGTHGSSGDDVAQSEDAAVDQGLAAAYRALHELKSNDPLFGPTAPAPIGRDDDAEGSR